jgi:signal transduction histidine kinase
LTSSFVIAGILLFAALFLSLQVRGQALENARRLLAGFSQLTAERTSQTLIAADLLLRSISDLAAEPNLVDPDALRQRARTRQFQDSLGNLRALLPQIDVEAVLDDRGDVVASSGGSQTGQTLGRSVADIFDALNHAPDIGLVVTAPAPSGVAGQWMFYMARALRDDSGRFAGVAIVGIGTSYFEGYFSTIGIGAGGSVALISDDARMIARWPRSDDFIGVRIGGPAPPALAPAGIPRVATVMGIDGNLRIVADTRLSTPDIPFHIAVTQPKALVLKPWLWMVGMTAGSTLVAVIVLAVLTLFLLRWLDQEERWAGAITRRESQLSFQAAELDVARHQAEGAQRARGRFIANMSHELRTPLNAIIGFAEIFRGELFGPLGNPRYQEFAADIHGSGEHLLGIVNSILDLAKIDSGKLALADDSVDVRDLLEFSGRQVAEAARSGGIELVVRPPAEGAAVRGDPIRLRQVLLNLLSNAVKFTSPGGHVVLSAEEAGDLFVLRVADTGIGMKEDDIEKVMQPFYQVDNDLTRRAQGTGLGLPLTKSLIELQGGRMTIESRPGEGTIVSVYMPRADERLRDY